MDHPRLRPESPSRVNTRVLPLIEYLGLDSESTVSLPLTRPRGFTPEVQNCHLNVWVASRAEGGAPQHGWILAQDVRHNFAEAIFHTVWRRSTGALVDVTPRLDNEKRVLFIPDPDRAIELSQFNGTPAINTFDNVRFKDRLLVSPLRRIQVVMTSQFALQHRLWPW
jgi:hypothetical protein